MTPVDKQQPARILIVEDEPIIALTLQDLLVEAGFEVAGVTGKLHKALALIEGPGCDAAIVDANLGGMSTSPAAFALAARGVPFIVLSGYSSEQLQGDFPSARFLRKPCRPDKLIHTLKAMVLKQISSPLDRPLLRTDLATPEAAKRLGQESR
jgi:DNA-binding response OmpR family regulator